MWKQTLKKILLEIKVELLDEFDRNFERKAFFNERWSPTKHQNAKGSLMIRTGTLRKSIKGKVQGSSVIITSSEPYASIHNEGGEISVTAKMKRYFWAMHLNAKGNIHTTASGRKRSKKQRERYSTEAEQWKALALKKVGTKLKIPKRQFIGWHKDLEKPLKDIIETMLDKELEEIAKKYKK